MRTEIYEIENKNTIDKIYNSYFFEVINKIDKL